MSRGPREVRSRPRGEQRVVVLDASVGVKWFRDEVGSGEGRSLLLQHLAGAVVIAVDSLFFYEVMAVVSRGRGQPAADRVWRDLDALKLAQVPLGDALVEAAAEVRAITGCSLYDAFSAGLAKLLRTTLYSADARAHGVLDDVVILGEEA